MPGIPGTTGITDMIAAEFKGYADLAPGFYVMGVNSDDGFRVTEATGVSRQVLHISGTGINQDIAVVNTTTNNSSYGGSLPTTPITAPLVYVSADSCPAVPDLTGKIAVVDLQRCSSADSDVVLAARCRMPARSPWSSSTCRASAWPTSAAARPPTDHHPGGDDQRFRRQWDVLKTNANLRPASVRTPA
jgi:hypothetical protein